MRASRIAAITVMGAAAFGVSAASAYADESGGIETSPHWVKAGQVVRISTEVCHSPAKVHVDIDGVRHWIWLATVTGEGRTGWFQVPRDTDPGRYEVEGRCRSGSGLGVEGDFHVLHHDHHRVGD